MPTGTTIKKIRIRFQSQSLLQGIFRFPLDFVFVEGKKHYVVEVKKKKGGENGKMK